MGIAERTMEILGERENYAQAYIELKISGMGEAICQAVEEALAEIRKEMQHACKCKLTPADLDRIAKHDPTAPE